MGGAYGRVYCGGQSWRSIRGATALLHVRKLVAEGSNFGCRQFVCQRFEERVSHACAGAMGEQEEVGRFGRTLEDGGNFAGILDGEMEIFWGGHLRGIL